MREEGSDITGQSRENVDGISTYRVKVYKPWVAPGLLLPLLRFRPQVIHLFHLRNALNWQATLLARLLGIPVVFTVVGPFHDPYLVDDRERPYLGKMYPRRLIYSARTLVRRLVATRLHKPLSTWQNFCMHYPLRAADRLIALSRHEVALLRRLGLDDGRRPTDNSRGWSAVVRRPSSAKVVRIPLWIDVPFIQSIPYAPSVAADYPSPHILFLGQLKERKGYDTLAHAMPIVLQACPTATFLFAGQNPARAEDLISICRKNGSESHLALLGKVSEEEKVRLMRQSECLVYPTRYESFGLPPLEAMAASCPVIASDLPVVNEMIQDGENGILVEPESPTALAEGIVHLLTDPALSMRLVEGGRRTLARYDEGRIITEIEQLYQSVLA
jgi:glycosyltransferase involved in cell wall biosynthesis